MRRKSCSIAMLLLLAAGAGRAAGPSAVQESSSVSLVEVPVTVLGKDDKPVRGLTAADFEVRDEGKLVKIESVDVSEFQAGPAAPSSSPAPALAAARRRFLLLFDLSYSTPSEIIRIREAAMDFVRTKIGPYDLAAVSTYSVDHGFNLVVTFTPDREQLAYAVRTLGISKNVERSPDPLQLTAAMGFEDIKPGGPGSGNGGGKSSSRAGADGAGEFEQNIRDMSRVSRREDASYRRGRVTKLLQNFGTLARALDSVEGRKQVILFSQGFDMRLLQGDAVDTQSAMEQSEAALQGAVWTVDSQQRFGNTGLQSALNSVIDLFKRSDCVVHAVDLAGLKAGDDSSDPSGGQGQDALFAFSNGTGGELFKNANNFSQQLDHLLEEQSVVYVLTFAPRPTGHPGEFHALKVKVVNHSGTRVSSRAGYYEPRSYASTTSVEKKLTAADVIASDISTSGIRAAVLTSTFAGGDSAAVPVLVHISADELAKNARGAKMPLEIYGYAFDEHGAIPDFFSQMMTLDLSQAKARLENGGLLYYAELRLPPGNFRLKTLVRNGETGVSGFTVQDLHVPDYSQKKPYLLAPLALGPLTRGLFVRGHSARSGTGASEEYPYMAGSEAYLPEIAPSVKPDSTLRFCLYSYNFETAENAGKLQLGGQVLAADGKPLGPASIVLASRSNPDASGKTTYLVDFKTATLSPGNYRLRLLLQDPVSGTARQSTTAFEVR